MTAKVDFGKRSVGNLASGDWLLSGLAKSFALLGRGTCCNQARVISDCIPGFADGVACCAKAWAGRD